jgi:hypothetical protein
MSANGTKRETGKKTRVFEPMERNYSKFGLYFDDAERDADRRIAARAQSNQIIFKMSPARLNHERIPCAIRAIAKIPINAADMMIGRRKEVLPFLKMRGVPMNGAKRPPMDSKIMMISKTSPVLTIRLLPTWCSEFPGGFRYIGCSDQSFLERRAARFPHRP